MNIPVNCTVCGDDTGILGTLCKDCYDRGYRLCLRCKRGYKPPDDRANVCANCFDDLRQEYMSSEEVTVEQVENDYILTQQYGYVETGGDLGW